MPKINDFEELAKLADVSQGDGDGLDCFIMLAGGLARSGKVLRRYEDGSWDVYNGIDDTWKEYKSDRGFRRAEKHIMEALEKGALYSYA